MLSLNVILISPACLYDGPTVLHHAVHGGIKRAVQQPTQRERQLYEKLLAAITFAQEPFEQHETHR